VSVTVKIPTILRSLTGGAAAVTVEQGTLGEVIASLDTAHPGIAGRILDDTGSLRRFINVYVDDSDVRLAAGLDTAVRPGSTVSIIPAVAGG
jgi:sulfur-carrier protein